ncbi:TetR/AcrR family transcriptional regulator [Actinomadura rubrisoli]|uniref:TetR/AcrR family transcriptional regulator n=1 Tax=Actinomadura rubrisoli TaxID=2530368 RepID=A0A4R4ZNN2_9ACTN|nr:TetR/AcrR family transcriptional regulator [Actinomadura rubrisoli]TDD60235.1 TetR/AcrR family transcriptional regulator [Actinomadura rubrisoli]
MRGRPRSGEQEGRRAAVLDAALAEVAERGYAGTTMLAVARRAGASKETLYAWHGNKRGLFAALIRRQAEQADAEITAALEGGLPVREALTGFAASLLRLLLGPASIAINRAAISAPELAEVLLAEGRHTTGRRAAAYLGGLAERGELAVDDPEAAFQLLYGLVIADRQIRVLLGEPPPENVEEIAENAVDRFLVLAAGGPGPARGQGPG